MADEISTHEHHGMLVHPGAAMQLAFSESLCLERSLACPGTTAQILGLHLTYLYLAAICLLEFSTLGATRFMMSYYSHDTTICAMILQQDLHQT